MKQKIDFTLVLAIGCMLVTFLLPLNGLAIDFLLTISLSLSLLTLLTVIYLENILAFSAFPSFLLLITLFRLGLNIASTRLILTEGSAGSIIKAFGEVVTGGNPLVGGILFALLTIVNLIVITKGSSRIAEVAARFHLDALPGKQMGIDQEMQAGLINQEEAQERRHQLMQESDFYGAMDGASKFVRGDAIAGVVIIFVNLLGGTFIGLFFKGMSLSQVVATYLTLTIGDGLVTQIPALFVSVAAGIVVTHIAVQGNLSSAFQKQLFQNPKVLIPLGILMLLFAILPGIPFLVVTPLAVALLLWAYSLHRQEDEETIALSSTLPKEELEKSVLIDPIEVEFGGLDKEKNAFFESLSAMRRALAKEIGIVIPSIRIYEGGSQGAYTIKIRGIVVDRGKVQSQEEFFFRLKEIIAKHAGELLTGQEVSQWVENAKMSASSYVNELIPTQLSFGKVLYILRRLLEEGVSIRDRGAILESLSCQKTQTEDLDLLIEGVRRDLKRELIQPYLIDSRILRAIVIDPSLEQFFQENIQNLDEGKALVIPKNLKEPFIRQLKELISSLQPPFVLLTKATIRFPLKQFLERERIDLPVLSRLEVPLNILIEEKGVISSDLFLEMAEK